MFQYFLLLGRHRGSRKLNSLVFPSDVSRVPVGRQLDQQAAELSEGKSGQLSRERQACVRADVSIWINIQHVESSVPLANIQPGVIPAIC